MLRGRLGLETARIPHSDRHGLLWLSRGALTVRDGTLRFERQAGPDSGSPLDSGEYGIPFQSLSMVLLGPGSTVSHDALRLMARHGTALVAVGEDGVRCYTAPPLMPDTSDIARRQMRAWGDPDGSRITVARKMYALRLGEVLPHQNLDALRGIEGARMKRTYQNLAQRYGIIWRGRRYDRSNPLAADIPNQAINHASVAVTSAAVIAVTAVGAIPQLGFIHEHSGDAFALDIADLFRDTVLLPAAFRSARAVNENPRLDIERHTRRTTGETLRSERVIPKMIDRIKTLFQDVAPFQGSAGNTVRFELERRSMTVVVTVNVQGRYRGFLASAMLEIAPGVYTSPQMTNGIRERIWDVLTRWHYDLKQGAIVMTWRDPTAVGEQRIRTLGEVPKEIVDADGVYLVKHS